MFNDARVWLSDTVEDSVLLSREVKRHGGALLQWTALDAMLHPNNARNVAFQTFAISDNAQDSHTKKAMGYKWICLRSSWLRECFKKGYLIDPTRFTLKVELQPRSKSPPPEAAGATTPSKTRKARSSKFSTKAKATGPKSTKTVASKPGRPSVKKAPERAEAVKVMSKVSKPVSAKKAAKPLKAAKPVSGKKLTKSPKKAEAGRPSKRRKLSKPRKKRKRRKAAKDAAFVEEISDGDSEEPFVPEISSDSEIKESHGSGEKSIATSKRSKPRKSSEAGREATRKMVRQLNSEDSPMEETSQRSQAEAIEKLLTPQHAKGSPKKASRSVSKPDPIDPIREKLSTDAETETEVEDSDVDVQADPHVSLESVEDTTDEQLKPVELTPTGKDEIEDPTPKKPRAVEVPGDEIKEPTTNPEIVEIDSGSDHVDVENDSTLNNGTEAAAEKVSTTEASTNPRGAQGTNAELELSQLVFELSGDRVLATRIIKDEASAFKQYRKLRWMKKKDEILMAMMRLRKDERVGAREQAKKLFFVLNRSEADCRRRYKFLKSAEAGS